MPHPQEISAYTIIKKNCLVSKNPVYRSTNVKSNFVNTTSKLPTAFTKSYAQVVAKHPNIYSNIPSCTDFDLVLLKLSSFLEDFKILISLLISLLTTLINTLIISKNDI